MNSIEMQFIVYFVYGLTFFSMGLVMLLESWRVGPNAPQAGLLRPMAAFGLLHGLHEWLEIFILQMERLGEPPARYFVYIRLGLLAVSFVALWFYSLAAFRFARQYITRLTVFGLVTLPLFALLSAFDVVYAFSLGNIPTYRLVGGLVRYGLGVPGAAIATLGLYAAATKARADARQPLDVYLNITALGFGLYSITQVFVPAMNTTLASWLNADVFLAWFGFPIQVVRTVAGMIITLGLFNSTQFLETERQKVVADAQKARVDALEQQEAMRRDFLRHIVQAQEDERSRFSRELHDEMAQILTAFSLDLGTLQTILSKNSKAAPILGRLQGLSRQMSQSMYRMVRALRPAHLDELGLDAALRYMLEQEYKPRGMNAQIKIDGTPRRLEPFAETVLFRIAQEALTNIQRHAQAGTATVVLTYNTDSVGLRVSDDGRGFDPAQDFVPPHGWGLAGIKERAESLGGRLRVDSSPGKGTVVEVVIPVENPEGGR